VGQNGKSLVEDNIDNFVKYYIECTQVINLVPDKLDLMPKNPELRGSKIPKIGDPKI
jgi:hypothetical protein